MLKIDIDEENNIVSFEPDNKLSVSDFTSAVKIIDPYINASGKIKGIIINTKDFPGWESFAALISHLSFVKNHHQHIYCVAFVTDSTVGSLAEYVAQHFISAEIRAFEYNDLNQAKQWIIETPIE